MYMREWLVKIRASQHLTQQQMATMISTSRAHYANIENGARHPSVAVAKKIAQILAFDWTLFYDESKKSCKKQTAS